MDVYALEACAMECGGHLDLAVHALLPQNRHAGWPAPADGGGRCEVEGRTDSKQRLAAQARLVLFVRAGRVVAKPL
jgi:hypothetical protein